MNKQQLKKIILKEVRDAMKPTPTRATEDLFSKLQKINRMVSRLQDEVRSHPERDSREIQKAAQNLAYNAQALYKASYED
jgi:hypothetical protein